MVHSSFLCHCSLSFWCLDGSSSRVVQDVWDVCRDVRGVVLDDVVLVLGDAASRFTVDDFWSVKSKNAEAVLFRAYALAGGPTAAGRSVTYS